MSEGTKFASGQYFAWGDTLYKAIGDCEVWTGAMTGETEDVCRFELECEPEMAIKMIASVAGDSRYLMIGSDTGMDDDAPEDDE